MERKREKEGEPGDKVRDEGGQKASMRGQARSPL